MNLQQATTEQSNTVFAIIKENAQWLENKGIVQWPLTWINSIKDEILQSVERGLFYVIEAHNQITAVIELRTEPEAIWDYDQASSLYIHKLAINRLNAPKGTGRDVIELIKQQALAQKIPLIRLDCVAHNKKLRQFYQLCGFTFIKEVITEDITFALYEFKVVKN